jgi:PPOX class probable F420-dependent enzyme
LPAILSDEAADFLDASRIARLATADLGARPHVVPLCYARDGAVLYFIVDEKPKAAGRTLKRLRNIAENPEVALVVDRYDEDWTRLEYVIVRGRAETVRDPEEFARGLGLLRRRYPQYETMRLEWRRNALIKISVFAAHHWKAS